MTMEATGSFWDCGEFISSCFKLEVPHPPGAPLFALMGRFFIILFGDNPHTAAHGVNFMSALTSGMSILFLFWIITHFARKMLMKANPQTGGTAGPNLETREPNKIAGTPILMRTSRWLQRLMRCAVRERSFLTRSLRRLRRS
jgi:hypothetical protein